VCAVLSSVCATTVDDSGVYVYYLKGIVSVCFSCPARTERQKSEQVRCQNR